MKAAKARTRSRRFGRDIHEIKSADILQPGPVALTEGLAQIRRIIERWAEETRP